MPEVVHSPQPYADATQPTLADRTINAAQWRFSGSIVQAVLRFGVGVLLARLLAPDAFGLVAFAYVVIGIAGLLTDFGFGPAIVQRRALTERHIRVSFTASVLLGLATAVALFLIAPLCGSLLQNPLLPAVLRVLALSFVIGGFASTAQSLLRRSLDFRRLFFIGLVSYSMGYALVGVATALLGFGVWSLVYAALTQTLLTTVLTLATVRHPVRPLIAPRELRQLLEFGVGANLNMIANYSALNGDNFIVGQRLGAAALGLYSRAYNVMKLPMEFFDGVMWAVLFPAFSEIGSDPVRLGRAYLTGVQATALAAGPIMAGMIVSAPHVIVGLYGPKWAGATVAFQILCLVGFFRAFDNVAGALTHASHRVYSEFARQSIYAALVLVGSIVGSIRGIDGVAAGVAVAIVYMYFAVAHLSLKIVHRSWREFFEAQVSGVVLGAVLMPIAFAVRFALEQAGADSLSILVAIVLASITTVVGTTYLLPRRLRPTAVFRHVERTIIRSPVPVPAVVLTVLRGREAAERVVSPSTTAAGTTEGTKLANTVPQ